MGKMTQEFVDAVLEAFKKQGSGTKMIMVKDQNMTVQYKNRGTAIQAKMIVPSGAWFSIMYTGVYWAVAEFDSHGECLMDEFPDTIDQCIDLLRKWMTTNKLM